MVVYKRMTAAVILSPTVRTQEPSSQGSSPPSLQWCYPMAPQERQRDPAPAVGPRLARHRIGTGATKPRGTGYRRRQGMDVGGPEHHCTSTTSLEQEPVSPLLKALIPPAYGYDSSYALEVYRQHPGRFGLVKPVDAAARVSHAGVEVGGSCVAFFVGVRPSLATFSSPAACAVGVGVA
jgi:hypothetical protein